jgi:hypothetical protein
MLDEISGSHNGEYGDGCVPCSLVEIDDVSEILTASIIRAMSVHNPEYQHQYSVVLINVSRNGHLLKNASLS